MIFGQPTDFAIEAYHEPSGLEWAGCGRMCLTIQSVCLGNIRENHCSLFDTVNRFRVLSSNVTTLWDKSFDGTPDAEIFKIIDQALYLGVTSNWERYGRFDFLTNTGEHFDGTKTFIICRSEECVQILYRLRDDKLGSASCSVQSFLLVAGSFVQWFDEQVRATAPPYFPVDPQFPT